MLAGGAPQLTAIELDPKLATAARDRVPAAHLMQEDATGCSAVPTTQAWMLLDGPSGSRAIARPYLGTPERMVSSLDGIR